MTHEDILSLVEYMRKVRSIFWFGSLNVVANPEEERIVFRIAYYLMFWWRMKIFVYSEVPTSIQYISGIYGESSSPNDFFFYSPYFEKDALGLMSSEVEKKHNEEVCILFEVDDIRLEVLQYAYKLIFKGYLVILIVRREVKEVEALSDVYITLEFRDADQSISGNIIKAVTFRGRGVNVPIEIRYNEGEKLRIMEWQGIPSTG